jgi:Ras-related protein Rab-7A
MVSIRLRLANAVFYAPHPSCRFQSLGVGFYRGADCAMLVYDITDPHSFDHLDHWRKEFLDQVGGGMGMGALSDSSASFPFVVLGNKMDKASDRLVPFQRAEDWCREAAGAQVMGSRPLEHFETSAKTAVNVDEAFHEVARLALQYEDYKRRSQPQLFVPPTTEPIDLRHQSSSMSNRGDSCC